MIYYHCQGQGDLRHIKINFIFMNYIKKIAEFLNLNVFRGQTEEAIFKRIIDEIGRKTGAITDLRMELENTQKRLDKKESDIEKIASLLNNDLDNNGIRFGGMGKISTQENIIKNIGHLQERNSALEKEIKGEKYRAEEWKETAYKLMEIPIDNDIIVDSTDYPSRAFHPRPN